METVGDLDFVVAATEVAPVVEWFVSRPEREGDHGAGRDQGQRPV
jgi:hypothetical protein